MLPSRKIGLSFGGVFIMGALAGGVATSTYTDTKLSQFMTRTSDPVSMSARINQKYISTYHLTPAEQARIEPLTQDMAQHLYQVRRKFAADVIATMDEYHAKIAEQMDPAHRAAYEKDNEDRKKHMTSMLLADPTSPTTGGK